VLSGLAGAAALLASGAAQANTPIDLFDDRKARKAGFDIIYEARDLDLPQNVRDGFTQARADLAATKARVKESEKRLDSAVAPSVQKAYWCAASTGGWGARWEGGVGGACGETSCGGHAPQCQPQLARPPRRGPRAGGLPPSGCAPILPLPCPPGPRPARSCAARWAPCASTSTRSRLPRPARRRRRRRSRSARTSSPRCADRGGTAGGCQSLPHGLRSCCTAAAARSTDLAHARPRPRRPPFAPSPCLPGLPPRKVEDLDLSLRKKSKDAALDKLQVAQAKLDAVLSAVL
jgi:hypothetical protein